MKTNHLTVLILFSLSFAFAGCASSKKQPATDAKSAATATKSEQTAAAPAKAEAGADKLTCTQDTETRVLEVVKKGAGCALDYTKAGKTSAVSTSQNGVKHCKDKQKKIRTTLEQAGYKCS